MVDVTLDAARRIGAASRDDEIAKLKAENKRLRDELAISRELKQMWQNRACQAERMLK
jgi:hypothetical protein